MERLSAANLKLQPDKCEFSRPEVAYLRYIIDKEGVRSDPKKLEAVKHFPIHKNPKNMEQFLGLTGYYRRFMEGFSKIAIPLNQLLKKDMKFKWANKHQEAFDTLKEKFCEEPLLQRLDFSKPFILTTDASGYAIGGILCQGKIGKDKSISYASRSLNENEKKYDTYEKEALAIVYCVTYFRPYLYGRKFTLITDHKPLVWFQNSKDPCSRVTRWKLKMAEYDFDVTYKAGKTNINSDALSRNHIDIENINDNDNNEEVNTTKVKVSIQDNILTELNTDDDDDEEEAPHMNLYCNEELNQEEIDSIKFVNDSEDLKIYDEKP